MIITLKDLIECLYWLICALGIVSYINGNGQELKCIMCYFLGIIFTRLFILIFRDK